jgi:hypothetical protein
VDENVGFEARAVLGPRRARRSRLALLLPVAALVAVAWAGMSGPRGSQAPVASLGSGATVRAAIAQRPQTTEESSAAGVARGPQPGRPATVIGLDVHRLDEVRPGSLGRDDEIAVSGWYVATAITDCPPLAAIYRPAALPDVRGDADGWAFCQRTGVLYASRPDVADSSPPGRGLSVVGATIVIGVVVPPELEVIGARATEVVVVGRLVQTSNACDLAGGCDRELLVDHIAWTPTS